MLGSISRRCYSTGGSNLKIKAKDATGNLSKLTVVLDNAGSKAGKSGLAHLLSKFTFLNTEAKSALRFTRESELLGGVFSSKVTRDAIVLNTQFLKEDLPYYVEALGNVLANTSFRPHEFPETVLPSAKAEYEAAHSSNAFVALEALHELSFRKGLGNPLYYDGTVKITLDDIKQFAAEAFKESNVSIHASGVNPDDLSSFIGESGFSTLSKGAIKSTPVSLVSGQQSRIRSAGESVALIGVPVKPEEFAKYQLLSATVGSATLASPSAPFTQIPGAASHLYKYNDAGLFVISVAGDAATVSESIKKAKKVVDSVSSADLSKNKKAAQLAVALESTLENPLSINVDSASTTPAKVKNFNYVAIGDVDVLPYAEEL